MAETYWLSFRIHDDAGYNRAYEELIATVRDVVGSRNQWWYDTTSFYVFASDLSISDIASAIKASIRNDRDLVVLGMPGFKAGRVIGHCADQDIFGLIPFMKKV